MHTSLISELISVMFVVGIDIVINVYTIFPFFIPSSHSLPLKIYIKFTSSEALTFYFLVFLSSCFLVLETETEIKTMTFYVEEKHKKTDP